MTRVAELIGWIVLILAVILVAGNVFYPIKDRILKRFHR